MSPGASTSSLREDLSQTDGTSARAGLPASRVLRVSNVGVLTFGDPEALVIEDAPPSVGRVVCVVSGSRFAFRRVLEVDGARLRLRCDVAPFEDVWEGEIVGCVAPRPIDRIAALSPGRFTELGWSTAMAAARGRALARKLRRGRALALRTESLKSERWPEVRAFWRRAYGADLPVAAQRHQHVVGLLHDDAIIGVNISLAFGTAAFSAFTLVDPRCRGVGGGTLLLEHAVREAKEQGFESMYVHIDVRNLPSIAAYRRVGFAPRDWWSDASDPLASAERGAMVFEHDLR